MALRQFNPVTASLRGTVLIDRSELWKGKPVKTLTEGKHKTGGRNNHGRTTSFFRGGGHKQTYRHVDFKRRKLEISAVVERLEYDPNRSARIALVNYAAAAVGDAPAPPPRFSYILAPEGVKPGDSVASGPDAGIFPGNALALNDMPAGTTIRRGQH